ncbi:hypothetical protein ACXU4N_05265 [Macrococcus psychrotolerans]|nr:hypothetical protein [Macrococcus sp. 19Msa1099]QYA32189.1 hypothetical protein KYI10_07265 [Macrococcus sp. 19Msa1099]
MRLTMKPLFAGQEDYISRKEISLLELVLNFDAEFFIMAVSFRSSVSKTDILPKAGGNIIFK